MKKLKFCQVFGILLMVFSATSAQAGDPAAGEATYSSMGCMGCHGPAGNSMAPQMFPKLSGLEEAYIATTLKGFRSGEIAGATMQPMSRSLTDENIENLAAYLAAQ